MQNGVRGVSKSWKRAQNGGTKNATSDSQLLARTNGPPEAGESSKRAHRVHSNRNDSFLVEGRRVERTSRSFLSNVVSARGGRHRPRAETIFATNPPPVPSTRRPPCEISSSSADLRSPRFAEAERPAGFELSTNYAPRQCKSRIPSFEAT